MSGNTFLDVDDTLLTSSLRLPEKDEAEREFDKIINSYTTQEKPSILVYPSPGVCVKVKNEKGEKNFVNVCVSDDIPPPEELSQEKLIKLVMEEDFSYVIPLSIGHERFEVDKSGVEVPTYDVLINKQYFEKCQQIKTFMQFTLTVIIEGVSNKFKKELNPNDHIILKNRKVLGKLQPHRIEKREVKKPSEFRAPGPLIQEIDSQKITKPQISDENTSKGLEYILLRNTKCQDNSYTGLFRIPSLSAKNVSVEISEDRLMVEDRESNSFVDIFLPIPVASESVKAFMDSKLGVLRIHLPMLEQ